MASLQDIERRIKSVGNTRKITKAMEMIAAAKLRKAQQRIETLRPFADSLVELTVRVSKGIQAGNPHPLLLEREVKRVAVVMFTGDRGLAGGFNANVLRRSLKIRDEWEAKGAEVRWLVVGKKGVGSLTFRKLTVDKAWRGITDSPTFRAAEEIGQHIIREFKGGDYDHVLLVYNHFDSAASQTVVVQDMLPLTDELLRQAMSHLNGIHGDPRATVKPNLITGDGKTHIGDRSHSDGAAHTSKHEPDWFFEPDSQALLDRLLPTYVEQTCFRALLESTASEHGSRMTAMRNASDNAGDLIDTLTIHRNRVRQAEITQQILEIVAGADAL